MKKEKTILSRDFVRKTVTAAVIVAVIDAVLLLLLRPDLRGICIGVLSAAALLALTAWWLHGVRSDLTEPLEELEQALETCARGGQPVLSEALAERKDALGELADVVQLLNQNTVDTMQASCEQAAQQAEQQARRSMAEEICQTALPKALPDIPSRAHFEVTGLIERGGFQSSQFYDYFFVDPGLLCVVLAQVPDSGVSEALYLVVAQTTIRNQLRKGRSLEETMADVNTQLYSLNDRFSLNALVATLSTADGRFTYVNAGQQIPLLMRNEDRYEWMEPAVFTPLGMNENVSYRSNEVRLKQGDRVFMYTDGILALRDRDGTEYGTERVRTSLNISRGKYQDENALMAFVRDDALAYDSRGNSETGFALLTLLYCKGEKELAHCDVPAKPEYAGAVIAFLKKQFEENNIERRYYAREAVIVDEVFALCCRSAQPDSHIMVECGVAPDAQMVNIRVTAVLGGVDPMDADGEDTAGNAVRFIEENADYVTFKAGEERDTITIVCFLG